MESLSYIRLSKLPIHQKARVCRLPDNTPLRHRLLALGLIKGTIIEAAFASTSGDPCAYYFRGTLLSVRNSDADHILVEPTD